MRLKTWSNNFDPSYTSTPLHATHPADVLGLSGCAHLQTWTKNFDPSYTDGSPKFDPNCECDSAPALEAAAPAPTAELA